MDEFFAVLMAYPFILSYNFWGVVKEVIDTIPDMK